MLSYPPLVTHRLYGLNIARMLGDRYLKEQDVGFTAEPFVSEGLSLGPQDEALLVVASDGLWDVVSQERVAAIAAKAAAGAGSSSSSSSSTTSGSQGFGSNAAGGGSSGSGGVLAAGGSCRKGSGAGDGAQVASSDAAAAAAGSGVADLSSDSSGSSAAAGGVGSGQPRKSVAAVVAEDLMQAALRLHSRDDISIMVLHVLPAALADAKRQRGPGESSSGSM